MKISIVIPTYNRKENLIKLFESLISQTHKDFEVILVDGGSQDGTPELENRFSPFFSIKCIRQRGSGFVDAVNTGLDYCTGELFLHTDDDVSASPDWLASIENGFNYSDKVGGVTGPVITPSEFLDNRDLFSFQKKFKEGNYLWRLLGRFYFDFLMEGRAFDICSDVKCGAFTYGANFPDALKIKDIAAVDHHESCNLAVRRDLMEKIGGFDKSFVKTSEYCDTDIAYKLRALGYITVFHPKAVIYHYPSKQGFFSLRYDSYHRIENFIRFYFRHIKPNTIDKSVRFLLYLVFLNGYFFYMFMRTGKLATLGSFPSTIFNLTKYSLKRLLNLKI
ncbi:MAG: glycosyltransferase family 2 protein [Candidatus Omnitrophica bacterium]|nr:glycosyltransferase family 2 protein [Candidatus Omnitrophota bacterium]